MIAQPLHPLNEYPNPTQTPTHAVLAGVSTAALIEDLAYHVSKYVAPDVSVQQQARMQTPWTYFNVHVLLKQGNQRIAIMCHAALTDEVRYEDALLLGSGAVDVIYHVRATDVLYHLEDIVFLLARWQPQLFSERGRINLQALATREVQQTQVHAGLTQVAVPYRIEPDAEEYFCERHAWPVDAQTGAVTLKMQRLHRGSAGNWQAKLNVLLAFHHASRKEAA